jgi:hypothetical protein
VIYCSGNLALNALNWMWFSKMLGKMVKRLSGSDKPASKPMTGAEAQALARPVNEGLGEKVDPGEKREEAS